MMIITSFWPNELGMKGNFLLLWWKVFTEGLWGNVGPRAWEGVGQEG